MNSFPDDQTIRRLLELAQTYGLCELEVRQGDLSVELRARRGAPAGTEHPAEGAFWSPASGTADEEPAARRGHALTAPLTGIFYRAPKPDEPAFVEVGQEVMAGQVVCLIEAMKIFSQIEADRSGKILEVVARSGELVHHGDVLMYIETEDEDA